jgi:hypothetical protein
MPTVIHSFVSPNAKPFDPPYTFNTRLLLSVVAIKEHTLKMPWQTAPSLIIIGGAFNLAALLMYGAQRLTGEVRTSITVTSLLPEADG